MARKASQFLLYSAPSPCPNPAPDLPPLEANGDSGALSAAASGAGSESPPAGHQNFSGAQSMPAAWMQLVSLGGDTWGTSAIRPTPALDPRAAGG